MQRLKEGTRERIVAAGRDEFMRKGFAAASMREIAQRAALAVGNLYRYFAGKEALFEAVVRPAHGRPTCASVRRIRLSAMSETGTPAARPMPFASSADLIEAALQEAQAVQRHRHQAIRFVQKFVPRRAHEPHEQRQLGGGGGGGGGGVSSNLKRTIAGA